MHLGGLFWATHFRRVAVAQVRILEEVLTERILPAFAAIDDDAERRSHEVYEALGQLPADDSFDMADAAETAQEAGLARYEALEGARQAVVNALTVALAHLVEQQLLFFHRRQVLHPAEENDPAAFGFRIFEARLLGAGVRLEDVHGWSTIKELRAVGNAIKHTDGASADLVRTLRPELFTAPVLRNTEYASRPERPIFTPLAGDDLYVTEEDFRTYVAGVVDFLEAFAGVIEQRTGA